MSENRVPRDPRAGADYQLVHGARGDAVVTLAEYALGLLGVALLVLGLHPVLWLALLLATLGLLYFGRGIVVTVIRIRGLNRRLRAIRRLAAMGLPPTDPDLIDLS